MSRYLCRTADHLTAESVKIIIRFGCGWDDDDEEEEEDNDNYSDDHYNCYFA
jgi:hypothetical protein